MRGLFLRGKIWLLSAAAGGLFVMGGCDPNVRDTVLGGVEGATQTIITTFISAFFESVQNDEEGAATTVRTFVESATDFFA